MLEVIGWLGTVLVVASLTVAGVWRFRVMNLVGAVLATAYNAAIGVWPVVAMNGAIALIDVYWLVRLQRERHDAAAYEVLDVDADDAWLGHLLRVHGDDVRRFHPGVDLAPAPGRSAHLVVRGDETVGVVLVRDVGGGTGLIEVDYVTPRFRDFTPGEFVYRRSGLFVERGLRRLEVHAVPHAGTTYLERMGFRPTGTGGWERPVEPVAA
ncbi:hypothetical protein [Cellulomonas marina]|uniref:Inner membrane protein n=1 Tax=Cellulomonas marina TaxID=988821 RepID=A0A1I0V481_9CELL|nr:hypothetical protein [Cellulomonas marina]SFA70890.1 hypothetical protein SAMN05421867_101135 [Cellulomonas marina]